MNDRERSGAGLFIWLGVLFCAACTSPHIVSFPCRTANDCGSGFECMDGSCVSDTNPDAGNGSVEVRLGEGRGADFVDVTKDVWLEEDKPRVNQGGASLLHTNGDAGNVRVALLRFSLNDLPTSATITDAVLGLTTWQDNPSNDVHRLHEVLEKWEEGNGVDEPGVANWLQRTATQSWSVAGSGAPSSRSTTVLAEFVPDASGESQAHTLSLPSSLVQRWLDDPQSNHGLAIVVGGADGGSMYSSEGPDDSRPYLEVTYSRP